MASGKRSVILALVVLLALVVMGFFAFVFLMAIFGTEGAQPFFNAQIAVVKLEGPLFESLDTLKELEEYREEPQIKAIVLRVDSPGGAVAPSQEIFSQILKLKEKSKKIVVSMGTVAASGGYYVASAADKIVASPGTITGSIGVIMQSFGVQELAKKFMVEPRTVKSGLYKDTGSPFRDMTPGDRAYLQALSDDVYEQFLRDVSEQRHLPLEKVRDLAEGKIYSGKQAKELGLVDELGNIYDAIALAKQLADLPEDAKVKWPHEPSSFEKWFASGSSSASLMWGNLFDRLGDLSLPLWMTAQDKTAMPF